MEIFDDGMTFSADRWEFTIDDGRIVKIIDRFHRSDDEAPTELGESGLLAFLATAFLSNWESDKPSGKQLEVTIVDNLNVEQVFTDTVKKLRSNYDSLYELFHALIYGHASPDQIRGVLPDNSSQSQLIDSFVDRATELFDFSTVWTFISSFEPALAVIVNEVLDIAKEPPQYHVEIAP